MAQELDEALIFHPRPIGDPVVWWLVDQTDKEQVAKVAAIKLDLITETLNAQLKAVESLKQILAP